MKQTVLDSKAKVAQQKLSVEQRGEVGSTRPTSLPRNQQQLSNLGEAQLYVTQMFFIQFCWNVN